MATRTETKASNRTGNATKLTPEEVAAARDRARELKAQARRKPGQERELGDKEVLAKIAEMPEADRAMAQRIHEIVQETAPDLVPRTWYGMPAYARDGKVIVWFQAAAKFKARYATFGVNDDARLDEGAMWPTSWALTELTGADEARIRDIVKKA
jgi:uncharacterized protein YdhG (YjbR/CyaY superfamily)